MDRRKFLKTAGTATAGVTAAAALATPAVTQSTKDMVILSTWPRDFPGIGISQQRLAARIAELSEGRINVQYFAANERVGAFDSFDEAASGNAQAYSGADYYWKGKHPGLAYFTSVPFGMTTNEITAWLRFGGGQDLWDEVSGEFGIKALAAGNTGAQMGGWFNKEINSVDDLQGLKMRIPGLGGDVMAKLGASPIAVPGGQIYENLVSGAIDATEWVGPYNDYFMKFYEVAKFYYGPGFHEPGSVLSLGMNKSWWESLTDWEKAVIEAAATEESTKGFDEVNANNGAYLKRMLDENGVVLKIFSEDIYDSFAEASAEVFEEVRDHSPLAKKINDNFQTALLEIGSWQALQEVGYTNLRNRALGL